MLDDSSRLRVLAEMGIDVYRLRTAPGVAPVLAPAESVTDPAVDPSDRVIVVSSPGVRADARVSMLLQQLPRALGISVSALAFIDADNDGRVAALPEAPAYLLLGAACAKACAAHLTLPQLDAATLAVIAEPRDSLRDASGKRALWQMLKPLARRMRADRS